MNRSFYDSLRRASQQDLYRAVNDPDDELYDIVWDLFESVVIEPAEVFDQDFRDLNQFRYRISSSVATLEFFPDRTYFVDRLEPNPYRDDSDAAGLHLKLSIMPSMTCLFSVGLTIWGKTERVSFQGLWSRYRETLAELLGRAKPILFTSFPFPQLEHASSVEEMLDLYFGQHDPEDSIELQYSFPDMDETGDPQNFMVYMGMLYHMLRTFRYPATDMSKVWLTRLTDFYSGYLPDLPPPLPCVPFEDA